MAGGTTQARLWLEWGSQRTALGMTADLSAWLKPCPPARERRFVLSLSKGRSRLHRKIVSSFARPDSPFDRLRAGLGGCPQVAAGEREGSYRGMPSGVPWRWDDLTSRPRGATISMPSNQQKVPRLRPRFRTAKPRTTLGMTKGWKLSAWLKRCPPLVIQRLKRRSTRAFNRSAEALRRPWAPRVKGCAPFARLRESARSG